MSLLESSETIRRKQVNKIRSLTDKIHVLKKEQRQLVKASMKLYDRTDEIKHFKKDKHSSILRADQKGKIKENKLINSRK